MSAKSNRAIIVVGVALAIAGAAVLRTGTSGIMPSPRAARKKTTSDRTGVAVPSAEASVTYKPVIGGVDLPSQFAPDQVIRIQMVASQEQTVLAAKGLVVGDRKIADRVNQRVIGADGADHRIGPQ